KAEGGEPVIYFMRAIGSDLVKIGYTEDYRTLENRRATLQTGQPWQIEILRVIEQSGKWLETWFHKLFAKQHRYGEWFMYDPTMMWVGTHMSEPLREKFLGEGPTHLEAIIEDLVNLLDKMSPDPDVEPSEDQEADEAEQYWPATRHDPWLAQHWRMAHEDDE